MVKVSVILPVYNTARYLRQCLDSVLAQTLKDIEVICVDDGSTDSSPDILREYAAKDKRIRLIHKENRGVVSARNTGITEASGKYIGFMDSDDWVEPDMYEKLCGLADRYQADMVSSGYFMEGDYVTVHYDDIPAGFYDEEKMGFIRENTIFNMKTREVGIRGSLWCKLFTAESLKKIQTQFSERLSMSEDKMCVLSYLLDCTRVYIAREAYYHYRIHQASTVHQSNYRYLEAVSAVYQYMIKLYEHPHFTKNMRMQAELYITEMLYKGINSRLGFENRNLLWVDPYWLQDIPCGAKVVLYGAGELGMVYRRQLKSREDIRFIACVDAAWERFADSPLPALPVDRLQNLEYDLLVITIKNPKKAQEVKQSLLGVPEEKIRWYEQKEIFWKYAEVNGWME